MMQGVDQMCTQQASRVGERMMTQYSPAVPWSLGAVGNMGGWS